MQVDPINPTLKAPGTKRLKLKCDTLLSTFAFKFHLRRYIEAKFEHIFLERLYQQGQAHTARHVIHLVLNPCA